MVCENMIRDKHRMSGFSLLEALITAIVLAIGVLGMAGLQGHALGNNNSSYLRSQAVVMAYDMMDRMRANRNAATVSGNYARDFGDVVPTQVCTVTACSAAQMAEADEKEWIESVEKLPDGDGSYTVNLGTDVATVNVRWDDTKKGEGESEYTTFTLVTEL